MLRPSARPVNETDHKESDHKNDVAQVSQEPILHIRHRLSWLPRMSSLRLIPLGEGLVRVYDHGALLGGFQAIAHIKCITIATNPRRVVGHAMRGLNESQHRAREPILPLSLPSSTASLTAKGGCRGWTLFPKEERGTPLPPIVPRAWKAVNRIRVTPSLQLRKCKSRLAISKTKPGRSELIPCGVCREDLAWGSRGRDRVSPTRSPGCGGMDAPHAAATGSTVYIVRMGCNSSPCYRRASAERGGARRCVG